MCWSLLLTATMIDAGFGMPTNCARAVPKGTNVATTNATDNSPRIAVLSHNNQLKLGRLALRNLPARRNIFLHSRRLRRRPRTVAHVAHCALPAVGALPACSEVQQRNRSYRYY